MPVRQYYLRRFVSFGWQFRRRFEKKEGSDSVLSRRRAQIRPNAWCNATIDEHHSCRVSVATDLTMRGLDTVSP
jgi:hypothetical protein